MKNNVLTLVLRVLVSVCAPIFFVSCTIPHRPKPRPVLYSETEMRMFWETNVRSYVLYKFTRAETAMPEINFQLATKLPFIRSLYENNLVLKLRFDYNKLVPDPFDSYVSKSVPIMELSLPQLRDTYRNFESRGEKQKETYESYLILHFMHALDRFSEGYITTDGAARENPLVMARNQKASWPITLDSTGIVLVKKYGTNIVFGDKDLHSIWIASGGALNSTQWDTFIKKRYFAIPP